MPSPDWEDLDDFLDTKAGFALAALVRLASGETRDIVGIFDEPAVDAAAGHGYELETTQPRFGCKETAALGISRRDELTVAGRTFDVTHAPECDGTGWCIIRLAPREGQGGR